MLDKNYNSEEQEIHMLMKTATKLFLEVINYMKRTGQILDSKF